MTVADPCTSTRFAGTAKSLLIAGLLVLALPVGAGPPQRAAASWPSTPPAAICGNADILTNPSSTPPANAVIVPAGDNSSFNFNRPGATFWFESGVHTLGDGAFAQIRTRSNTSYIGAPGAILDGRNKNRYAFVKPALEEEDEAVNVTIRYLTIRNFGRKPQDTESGLPDNNNEGVVNHDAGDGWTIEYNTISNNSGAGVFLGSNNVVRYNCLKDNGQYGFSMYKPPHDEGDGTGPVYAVPAITNIVLDHNEIVGNNTDDWEALVDGCGCTGGGKFWDVKGAQVTNNWVHHNKSVGLWADTNNIDFLFEGNFINDNSGEGIWYEISYNATIRGNTFLRNAWVSGQNNHGSPGPAVYLSESGGNSLLASTVSGSDTLRVIDNYFEDNFSGVTIYENANRFCNSLGNTSTGYCTPFIDPPMIPEPYNTSDYNEPANPTHPCYTRISEPEFKENCRWHAKNIEVTDNEFYFDDTVVPCGGSGYCGVQALMVTGEDNLKWSPYTVTGLQNDVMFNNGNRFANNHYYGKWRFAKGWGERISFAAWQAAPYNQDAGSTFDGGPPVTNVLDADTATLEGSTGHWAEWYSAAIAQSAQEAHGGAHSLRIEVTDSGHWGVQLDNYPGFESAGGRRIISFWVKGGAGAPSDAHLSVEWFNGDGSPLGSNSVAFPTLTSQWQQVTAIVDAPVTTNSAYLSLTGEGSTGTYFFIDDIRVGAE